MCIRDRFRSCAYAQQQRNVENRRKGARNRAVRVLELQAPRHFHLPGPRGGQAVPLLHRLQRQGQHLQDRLQEAVSAKTKAPPRRTILWIGCGVLIAAAVVLYLVFLRGGGRFSGATGDASVLLITIDTLRADHLGAYGDRDIRTPVIDTLADEGVLFENAITPAIETLPSHATILTGTWPPTHGIRDNGDYRLSPE